MGKREGTGEREERIGKEKRGMFRQGQGGAIEPVKGRRERERQVRRQEREKGGRRKGCSRERRERKERDGKKGRKK